MLSLLLSLLLAADVYVVTPQAGVATIAVPSAIDAAPDAWAALDSAERLAAANPGSIIIWPPAEFSISRVLELAPYTDHRGAGSALTKFRNLNNAHVGPIFFGGGYSGPAGVCRWPRVDGMRLQGVTIKQTAVTSAASHCAGFAFGDDCFIKDVVTEGARHEGFVTGGWTVGWVFQRCVAYDIGAGSQHRAQSGAGWNINGINHTAIDCQSIRCAQGFEHGGIGGTFIRCKSIDGAMNPGSPSYGFNMGNAVVGLQKLTLVDCENSGSRPNGSAVSVGNIIGRVGQVAVVGFTAVDSTIGLGGGKTVNSVPGHAWELPDGLDCWVVGSKVKVTRQQSGTIGYHYNGSGEFGRQNWAIVGSSVELFGLEPDWYYGVPFLASGAISGRFNIVDCWTRGMRVAPKPHGDFLQQAASHGAPLNPSPNVRLIGNRAIKDDGTMRAFRVTRATGEE